MPAHVDIVIPNWNGAPMLAAMLETLRCQTYPTGRVIVVDNGSTDHSTAVAMTAGAQVIPLGANLGFAAAVNRGIQEATQEASTEYVAIMNNDVTLPPDWLARLMARLEDGQAWFATGKLLNAYQHDRLDGAYDAMCRGGCALRCGHGRLDSEQWNRPKSIHLAPLTAAVFRASIFKTVGLLDERFESFLEDIDFGLRCAEAGFSGLYAPEAVAYHRGSATLGRWHPATVRKIARNQVLLIAKHYPPNWVLRYGWSIFIAQTLWGLVALRHGTLLAYLAGKLDGVRQFRAARGKRCAAFPAIIEESEKEIRDIQQSTGFDLYWRLYFALT